MSNSDYYYNPSRDDVYISDYENSICCVREYKSVVDSDDLARWRQMWYPSCRICPRQKYCYASHQMQRAKPSVVI